MHWITSSLKPEILTFNQIYFPLLNIVYFKPANIESCDIAIFTSQHGITRCNFNQGFAVGEKTAKCLDHNNISVFNNVAELKKNLINMQNFKIIYFRGRDVTDNLDFLAKKNTFISKIVYEANGVPKLSEEIIDLLQNNKITKVTINSARSYKIFIELMAYHNLNINLDIVKNYSLF